MTLYLDVILLENFILNYIILLSTAIISKAKISVLRIIEASIIGGIFAILNYVANINFFLNIIIKITISILMIIVAFNEWNLKRNIKQLIFFYLVSFTFGGIAFMLLFFLNPQNVMMKGNSFVGTYPLKITVLAGGIGFIVIILVTLIIKSRMNKNAMICDMEIFYDGNIKKVKTMLDTGNLLKEPISNADVIIVEKESLNGIVSKDILENINNIVNGKWIEDKNIHSYKFKLIPFSSLGKDNGLLIGFKPDYVKIYNEEECIRNDVLIGIYNGKLSKNNIYTSLIGLDVINSSKIKEHI